MNHGIEDDREIEPAEPREPRGAREEARPAALPATAEEAAQERKEAVPARDQQTDDRSREPDTGKQLMLAFQGGDEQAFDRVVLLYQDAVKHFLRRYVRDAHRTEDLTQEVFIRVYRSRERYQPSAAFRTWLFTIATRLGLNEIRGLRRRRRVFAELADDPESPTDSPLASAADYREPGPEGNLAESELEEVLNAMIGELPENQRAAILLNRTEELSYREIAEVLGVTVMAVKSLLMRAREALRSRVANYLQGRPLPDRLRPDEDSNPS